MSSPAQMQPPPRGAVRLALLISVLIGLGLAVLFGVRMASAMAEQARIAQEREQAAGAHAAEVDVVRPGQAQALPYVVLTGTLEPAQAADLAFEVPGRVSTVQVALGQEVHAGDPLVTLDRASVGAQSAQSTAAIGVADANAAMLRDRVALLEPLANAGTVPQRELTTARQQLAIAEAQLAQARAGQRQVAATSADHTLRAPFDGVVTRVPSGVGVVATPGMPLVRVEDLSSLHLRTTVNENELGSLHTDMPVALEGSSAHGVLRSVVRSLDAQTRRAPVEVQVPNADGSLVANAFVRARIVVGAARPALRVPSTSRRPNGSVLIVGVGDRVEARAITAEADSDGSWLVTDGLAAGDRVLVRPAAAREGVVVRAVEREGESRTAANEAEPAAAPD